MPGPPVPFSALPLHNNADAPLNAWGAHGPNDELGFLNRQTDETVAAAAASEIRDGTRVSLDAAMDLQGDKPMFGRQVFRKDVYLKNPRCVHDDTWHFNTQSSTQWDGFRHFGYQKARRFYNDTTVEDISGESDKSKSRPNILGIQNFAKKGIVGRGVLVDFARWAEGPGKKVIDDATGGRGLNPLEENKIKLEWLLETLRWQGTGIRFADILIVRSGFMKAYRTIPNDVLEHLFNSKPPPVAGVEASTATLEWIWNNFSAVAGDQPAFEALPMEQPNSAHEVLLAGWGCPIGELFHLEELSQTCESKGRWSFFFSSQVVNVPGGVASPPNALAIF